MRKGLVLGILFCICLGAAAPRTAQAPKDWSGALLTLDNPWLSTYGYDHESILAYNAWRHNRAINALAAQIRALDVRLSAIEPKPEPKPEPDEPADPNVQ